MGYEVSVVLLSYNPDFEKLKSTINSVIKQQDIELQLIIADDGSKCLPYKEIMAYLKENSFEDYLIVDNSENKGTVKNYISGVEKAEGTYIKAISPGDFLYDTTCLRKIVDYMEQHAYKICFGKSIYYYKESEQYNFLSNPNPVDLNVYKAQNYKKILTNYFVYQDYVLGANFIVEKELLLNSLRNIEIVVKYAEDTSVLYMLANGEKIGLYDDYFLWYEYGTGISTGTNDKWKQILYNENKAVYEIVMNTCIHAKKGYIYNYRGEKINNKYIRMLRWITISPGSIFFWMKRITANKHAKQVKDSLTDKLYAIIKI